MIGVYTTREHSNRQTDIWGIRGSQPLLRLQAIPEEDRMVKIR